MCCIYISRHAFYPFLCWVGHLEKNFSIERTDSNRNVISPDNQSINCFVLWPHRALNPTGLLPWEASSSSYYPMVAKDGGGCVEALLLHLVWTVFRGMIMDIVRWSVETVPLGLLIISVWADYLFWKFFWVSGTSWQHIGAIFSSESDVMLLCSSHLNANALLFKKGLLLKDAFLVFWTHIMPGLLSFGFWYYLIYDLIDQSYLLAQLLFDITGSSFG